MNKHIKGFGLLAACLLISGVTAAPAVTAASSLAKTNVKKVVASSSKWDTTTDEDNNAPSSGSSNEETTQEPTDGNTDNADNTQASAKIEKVIADGMKYEGTPYEFGSSRSTTKTFDCSDFTRWIFKETLGINLPADSRQQGTYVKDNGTAVTDWHDLKRGDLMFFLSYKGSKAANYTGIDKTTARITHVGIYLGNGKILHTYSNESGGVHEGDFAGTAWEYRFLFGGSVLPQ